MSSAPFVVKVVIEVARADAHFVGYQLRRDVRLAEIVEQLQGCFENALTGTPFRLFFHAGFLFVLSYQSGYIRPAGVIQANVAIHSVSYRVHV